MDEEDLGTTNSTEISNSTKVLTQRKKVNFLRRTELSDEMKQQKFDEASQAMKI